MATALTNIDDSDAELRSKLQQVHFKYSQEIGSLEKKGWNAKGIIEIVELRDVSERLRVQFGEKYFLV